MKGAKPPSWISPSARTRRAVSPLASSKRTRAKARSKSLRRRVARPGLLRRPGVAEPRVAEQVVVAEVAPVGDQQPVCAVAPSGGGIARDVRGAVLDAREQAVPGRGARADPEGDRVLGELRDAVVVVLGLVPPVEQHQLARDLGDPLGMRVDDVAPDHGPLAVHGSRGPAPARRARGRPRPVRAARARSRDFPCSRSKGSSQFALNHADRKFGRNSS